MDAAARRLEFEIFAPGRVRVTGALCERVLSVVPDDGTSVLVSARELEIPRGVYPDVLAAARREAGLRIVPIPPAVLAIVDAAGRGAASRAPPGSPALEWSDVAPRIRAGAMPFQADGIRAALARGGRLLIADEMGLGKTIQGVGVVTAALAAARRRRAPGAVPGGTPRALVMCPGSVGDNWLRELAVWTDLRAARLDGGTKPRDWFEWDPLAAPRPKPRRGRRDWKLEEWDVVVCSVDLAKRVQSPHPRALVAAEWTIVVVDESHWFQSAEIDRTRVLLPVMRAAPHLVCLSGTPQNAAPAQLWAQITGLVARAPFVSPACGGEQAPPWLDWRAFTTRYCGGHYDRYGGWDARGCTRSAELSLVLSGLMVRRLAADVLRDLPPMTCSVVTLVLPPADLVEIAAVGALLAEARERRDKSGELAEASAAGVAAGADGAPTHVTGAQKRARRDCDAVKTLTMEWWRATGRAKAPQAVEFCVELERTEPSKILLFCNHACVREALVAAFDPAKVVAIHGETPMADRQGLVDQIADPAAPARVAVLSLRACSAGLNFAPGARVVVFVELDWSPTIMLQAMKRVHRIGCTGPVRVIFLEARGTIDSRVLELNRRKLRVNIEVVGSGAEIEIAERSVRLYAGAAFARVGVLEKCAAPHASLAPLDDAEPLAAWVRRACVEVDAGDWPSELMGSVSRPAFDLNTVNAAAVKARSGWCNLDEWADDLERPVVSGGAALWVLSADLDLDAVRAVQAVESPFERCERVGAAAAVFYWWPPAAGAAGARR